MTLPPSPSCCGEGTSLWRGAGLGGSPISLLSLDIPLGSHGLFAAVGQGKTPRHHLPSSAQGHSRGSGSEHQAGAKDGGTQWIRDPGSWMGNISNRKGIPGCPGPWQQAATMRADFILGRKRNQKWREATERATLTPPDIPTQGTKAKSIHKTKAKGPKERRKVSLTHWLVCVFSASVGRGYEGTSKRTGVGLSMFLVITFYTSSRRSIMSQAGHSLVSVPPSLCSSIHPGHERKSVGLSGVCGPVSISIWVCWLHFSSLHSAPLDEIFLFVIAAGLASLRIDDGSVSIRGIV